MTASVVVAGHEGTWESLAGDVAVLALPKAFAPGAPLHIQATLSIDGTLRDVTVSAKTVNSKRRGELFEVTARLQGVTRQARAWVTAHFQPA